MLIPPFSRVIPQSARLRRAVPLSWIRLRRFVNGGQEPRLSGGETALLVQRR
jgi:hypothetical protein